MELGKPVTRYAPYYRSVMGDFAGDAMSVAEQRSMVAGIADDHPDWSLVETYEDICSDDFERKAGASLRRLFADAISGRLDVVVVAKPNRLSRQIWVLHEIYEQLKAYGVTIYSALHRKPLHEVLPPAALQTTAAIMRAMDAQWDAHRDEFLKGHSLDSIAG